MKGCILLLIPILLCCKRAGAGPISIDLNQHWQFRKQGDSKWLTAKVPGTIHADLLANKLIPDPFYRDNEKKLQWIEKENWDYRTIFDVDGVTLGRKNVELVFDGLDTYADVYLNSHLVLHADNMFRGWTVDVKHILRKTGNTLFIRFYAVQNKIDSIAKSKLPFVLPDNARAYVRKAQYNFGWDFAPKLITCGIWKPVKLNSYNGGVVNPYVPIDRNHTKLIQLPDSIGNSFYFQVNGKPVYIKGANWVPADVFLPGISKAKYRQLLILAKRANMNMLRVWGGGVYEDDYFYHLCDSLHIMVWQDFMFAGAMVPGDEHFFDNVREEVAYQVKRLRDHPCIVLWCGNNEVDEAWHDWGWQLQFNLHAEDSAKVWNDYRRLFEDSLRSWVNKFDGTRPYVSSSPMHGWGTKESITEGDSHYWGVWWGLQDVDVFEKKTGRFVSEYGMQAMPGMGTTEKFTVKEDRYLYSAVLRAHQKHAAGFENIKFYLHRYFLDSSRVDKLNLENYTYLTQCLQSYVLKTCIAIHRGKYPANMGTLLWQLNDSWPGISWSILDYSGQPKAAWYAVKDAYRDDNLPKKDAIYPKDLSLKDPKITIRLAGNKILVRARQFAKYVEISCGNGNIFLSDNYFDLLPGESKVITIDNTLKHGDLKKIRIRSLYDVIN